MQEESLNSQYQNIIGFCYSLTKIDHYSWYIVCICSVALASINFKNRSDKMLKMKEKLNENDSIVNLSTEKFGNLHIKKKNIIAFDNGVLGFEDLRQFVIVNIEECLPFEWLVSVEDPLIAFPILNPMPFFTDYNPMKSLFDLAPLASNDKEDLEIFCMVTLGNSPTDVTINLKGPIFVNMKNKKGKQCVLTEDYYSLHHPLLRA